MKKFQRAGYRIHFDRLRDIKSDASFKRTHKFKCEIPNKDAENELKEKFEDVAKVVDSCDEGSIPWFLIQLYGLGFLFVPNKSAKMILLSELQEGSLFQELEEIIAQVSPKYKNKIVNPQALFVFLTKRRQNLGSIKENNFLPQALLTDLGLIFEKETRITAKNIHEFPVVQQCHDELKSLLLAHHELSLESIQNVFGVKVDLPDTEGTTFVIQEIPLLDLKQNVQKGIDIYTAYFKYLFPAAQKSGREVQSLAGVGDKQKALSNFLNLTLRKFQESEGNCNRLLQFGNPEFFQKNSETLEFLAKTVHGLAKKVSMANKIDFLSHDWSQYRASLGGRLQGWLSNFENRLAEYEKVLSNADHSTQSLLKKIQEGSKFKSDKDNSKVVSIYPTHFRNNFEKLSALQPQLLLKLRDTLGITQNASTDPRDLGAMIDEYRQFLQPVNEFLMKWNNEGVPANPEGIDLPEGQQIQIWNGKGQEPAYWISGDLLEKNKKRKKTEEENEKTETSGAILGFFKKDLVPQDLPRYPRFLYEGQKPTVQEQKLAEGSEINHPIGIKLQAARHIALNAAKAAEAFCASIEKQKDEAWEDQSWISTRKNNDDQLKTVWHLGQFHKSLQALKEIGQRAKNPLKIAEFLNEFILQSPETSEWKEYCEMLKSQEYNKVEEKNFVEFYKFGEKIEFQRDKKDQKSDYYAFYLSGREYGKNWKIYATSMLTYGEFLSKFEEVFGLDKIKTQADYLEEFLQIENGATDESITRAELLKFWWARRMAPLRRTIELRNDFSGNMTFVENILASLIFQDNHQKETISNADASRFLQAGLAADLRAKVGLLSRKEFVIRNVIQSGDGSDYQTFLEYQPLPWGQGDEVINKEQLQSKMQQIQQEMDVIRGKDTMKYQTLKRKLRRLKLASRSRLQKLQKQLYHLQRDQNNFSEQGADEGVIAQLKKRKTLVEEKIHLLEKGGTFGFSPRAKEQLQELFKGQDIPLSNEAIVEALWAKKEGSDFAKNVALLGEIPHRWRVVLRTTQKLNSLQEIQKGFFFGKSDGGNVYNIKPKKNGYLYAFPVETSVVQKQFLERFLWGEYIDNKLQETILGSSVILERTNQVLWNNGKISFNEKDFQLYCAFPFQFSTKKIRKTLKMPIIRFLFLMR